MAKSRKRAALEAQLNEVRVDPTASEAVTTLQQLLKCKYGDLVAQAAKLVDQAELTSLTPALVAAFERCLQKPVETDPNCLAKCAIATTLYHFTHSNETLFLTGIRHIQMEPVWGGTVDTAANLRSICALGLVRMHYPGVMVELADLLADAESDARIGAARAIAYTENTDGLPLLRLRALVGDQPEVVAECLIAMLRLDAEGSLAFVARFLEVPQPQIQELVALALGESRVPAAFEVLQAWWSGVYERDLRRTGLMAIAMVRTDPAIDFLIHLVATGPISDAEFAISALQLYRTDAHLWDRLQQVVYDRGEPRLIAAIATG